MDIGNSRTADDSSSGPQAFMASRLKDRFAAATRLAKIVLNAKWAYVFLTPEAAQSLFPGDDDILIVDPRSQTPCAIVVRNGEPLIISDARAHPITRDLPPTQHAPDMGFYTGCPIRGIQGRPIGSLCVLDPRARSVPPEAISTLEDIASTIETELKLAQASAENIDLASQLAAARKVATIDPLTGLWNRPAVFEVIQRELGRCHRTGDTFALAMLDVDHFKRVNDTLGHQAGDQVLASIANRLLDSTRSYDAVGRYGGEEFVILLVGCDEASAKLAGEKVLEAIRSKPVSTFRGELMITASLGMTVYRGRADRRDLDRLLFDADHALLQAKAEGRNRLLMAGNAPSNAMFAPPS